MGYIADLFNNAKTPNKAKLNLYVVAAIVDSNPSLKNEVFRFGYMVAYTGEEAIQKFEDEIKIEFTNYPDAVYMVKADMVPLEKVAQVYNDNI